MHPNLMGAARFQPQAQQAAAVGAPFQHPVMGAGGLALRRYPAAHALRPSDGRVDDALRLGRRALGDGQVLPHVILRVQQPLHAVVHMSVEGHGHQPAGALIQAAHRAVDKVLRAAQMGVHRVFQGAGVLPGAVDGGQGRGLLHDQQIAVPPGHGQGNRAGRHLRGPVPQQHPDLLPCRHPHAGMGRLPVQQDAPAEFEAAHPMAGESQGREHAAQGAARLLRRDDVPQLTHRRSDGSGSGSICPTAQRRSPGRT